MSLLDEFLPQGGGQALNNVAHSAFLSLLASPGNAPFAAMPRILEGVQTRAAHEEDATRQRAALKAILKQSDPSLSDAQLEIMANDPKTAQLAMTAAQTRAEAQAGKTADGIMAPLFGGAAPAISPAAPAGPAAGASLNGGTGGPPLSGTGAEIQTKFVDSLKAGGLTNPFGLAAVAAYAQHESRYDPKNINGQWSDPSERGQPGTSGGILSWRDGRLERMRAETQGAEDPIAAQAQFTLKENPELTARLQAAKSPEEAHALMADAWKFAGYNRPGGENAARLATTQSYASRLLSGDGQRPTQVADASGAMPQPPGMPVVDSRQPGFNPNAGGDPLAGFVPSGGPGAPSQRGMPDLRGVPPVGGTNSSPPPPAPKPRPGMRAPVQVAETEADTQVLESRMGMYPPSVYGVTANARGAGNPQADMPAPDAQNAEFIIPPGGVIHNGRIFGADTQTGRVLGERDARSPGQMPGVVSLGFGLSDPQRATEAIPKLMQVLSIPNLPESMKVQAKTALDFALNTVKPSERSRQLIEAGYTPGTPEFIAAARRQISDARPAAVQEYEYSQTDPGFDAYRDRRSAKAEPQIAAQVAQRREAATSLGLQPGSPGYQSYVLTGKMPNEDKPGPSAGDKKVIQNAEDELPNIDGAIASLTRAKELNPQTYTGRTASVLAQVGTSGVPGAGIIADATKAGKTREFGQLMSMEAIKSMSQTLKGATTDAEMGRFMEILGDPSTPPDIRGRTIDRMLTLAQRQKEIATARVNELREGTYYKPGREQGGASANARPAPSPTPAAAPPAAAVNMLRQNPDLATQFDAKYGAGASRSILGGR